MNGNDTFKKWNNRVNKLVSMSVFVSVVESGSLSGSSRKLRMPLATVSRKISELESLLGVRLLTRTTRRIELTDAGKGYFVTCKRILEEMSEAERSVSGEYTLPKGDLVVTAPVVFGRIHVLPIVAEFLKAYPEINIHLVLSDRFINLMEEHIDLAVRIGELPDSAMVGTRVGMIHRVTCASPSYLAARGTPKEPNELAKHECISIDAISSPEDWTYYRGKEKLLLFLRPRLRVTAVDAGIGAAVAGVGITCALSYQIEKPLLEGKLQRILEAFEPPAWPVHVLHNGTRNLPLKVRAFRDFVVARIKEQIPQN